MGKIKGLLGDHYAEHMRIAASMSRDIPVMRVGADNPNQRAAYAMPLSRLADMWRAKFGDTWIDVSELDEEFWMDASSRLHRNKLMEELEFRNSNTPWARLKEGV